MRSFFKAATLWQAAISTAFIIPPKAHHTLSNDILTVAGSIGPDAVSIDFQAFCPGWFVGTDSGLELKLTVGQSDEECDVQHLSLNGLPLLPSESGDVAKGNVVFKSRLSHGLGEREVFASWESLCLNSEASMLSVNIHSIDGQDHVEQSAGFTASFQQRHQPTVLRLQARPLDLSREGDLIEEWQHPGDSQRLIITAPMANLVEGSSLEQEFTRMEELQLEIHKLHQELKHQERKILHMLKQDFRTCSSMKCLFQTAVRKIPDITQLLKSHFRHHPKKGVVPTGPTRFNCSRALPFDGLEADTVQLQEFDGPFEALEHPPLPNPPFHGDHSSPPPPHPSFEGRPPPPPPPPAGDRPFFGPPFGNHHRRHVVKGATVLIVIALVMALLFRHVRRHTSLFQNPRRSADRAARQEERRNRREYRRAARRHQWAQWWNRYRRPRSTSDYEEKREMILQQENVLEDAMQGEIRNLRTAHEIVGEMIRAEEGRAQLYYQANLPPSRRNAPAVELGAGVGPSRISSLPTYVPPPPQYEEELEGDITVVDGFRYTPSASDETPDSSVVDCSPRLSFETGRTTLVREPGE